MPLASATSVLDRGPGHSLATFAFTSVQCDAKHPAAKAQEARAVDNLIQLATF